MSNKLKALGLAFVASLALSVVAASGASANGTMHYSAPQAPTVGTGTQATTNVFTTNAGEIICSNATFEGTQTAKTETTLTATAKFSSCTAFGIANTHINMNSCDFEFTTPTGLSGSTYSAAPPHVRCGSTPVTITPTVPIFGTSVCTVTIGAQTPESGTMTAQNQGSGNTRDVLVSANVGGISYTVHGGGGLCGSSGSDATYKGSVTLRGYEDSETGHANHNGVHEPIEITGS